MNRFVVLVDAGHLLSQSVQALSHMKSKARKDVTIHDPQGLISMITSNAAAALGVGNTDLLRVYWYDGVFNGRMSNEQEALALLPDVQLRQGIVNRSGVQKGIDSKMMVDLMELSTNQAISDAVLFTGDGDLVIAIEWAQRRGVRVALMGIEEANGVPHNQSFEAVCMADRVRRISRSDIAPFLSYTATRTAEAAPPVSPTPTTSKGKAAPAKKTAKAQAKAPAPAKTPTAAAQKKPAAPKAPQAATDSVLTGIVDRFIESAAPPFTRATVTPTGAIGQAIDGKLLLAATAELERKAMPSERTKLRKIFRDRLLTLPEET